MTQSHALPARLVTIIGGGIGGLTAALALTQRGAAVTVLERAGALREVGAGIQLSPNAMRVIDALGLGTEFGKLPVERQAQELASRTAKLLGSGSPSVFADPKNLEKLIGRFLVRAEAVTSSQSAYNAALVLLR